MILVLEYLIWVNLFGGMAYVGVGLVCFGYIFSVTVHALRIP